MSDSAQREWRFYIDDMIGFADKVIAYTQGLEQDGNDLARQGTIANRSNQRKFSHA